MTTLQEPTTPAEHAMVEYGNDLIAQLLGSTVTCFGANEKGEVYLSTVKDDKVTELIIGKDDATGEITLFEVEKTTVEVPDVQG